jgi:hypothetical protein
MHASNLLLGVAILSVLWGVVSSLVITSYLSQRGIKVNFLLLRLFIIKYIAQYQEITRKETGKPGGWFYSFVISMNLALVTAVIGLILRGS